VLKASRVAKLAAIEETPKSITALEGSKEVINERLGYYTSRDYMNTWGTTAVVVSGASLLIDIAVTVANLLAGGLKMMPQFTAGVSGFGGSPVVNVN